MLLKQILSIVWQENQMGNKQTKRQVMISAIAMKQLQEFFSIEF